MTQAKILLVEDEGIIASNLEMDLLNFGYIVSSVVSNGLAAIEKAEEDNPDIILMDIGLPGEMDGIEAADQIRKKRQIPIIYLTAHSTREILERAKAIEPYTYLLKPYNKRELFSNIEMSLQAHKIKMELLKANKQLKEEIVHRNTAEKALLQKVKEISTLNTLTQKLISNLSLDQVVNATFEGLVQCVNPDMILLFFHKEGKLILHDSYASHPDMLVNIKPIHQISECLCGLAVTSTKSVCSINIHNDPRCTLSECKEIGFCSIAALPLRYENNILGVFNLGFQEENKNLLEQIDFLEIMSNSIANGLHNALLYEEVKQQSLELAAANQELNSQMVERKQVEKKMTQMRHYQKNVIDSMPSIIVSVDSKGRVIQWNNKAEKNTGLTIEQVKDRPVTEVLTLFADHLQQLTQSFKQTKPQSKEKVLIIMNKERNYFNIMIYPLIAEEFEGAVIRIDDVTSQVFIEEMMIQNEKMMSIGGLAAGMAHEINNPLSGILNSTQNLLRRISPDLPKNSQVADELGININLLYTYLQKRNVTDFVEGIKESCLRAANIVSSMLQFSRRSQATKELANISDIVNHTIELAANDYDLKKKYDFRHIQIVRKFESNLKPINIIITEIEQVILNLLKNAAQALGECSNNEPPTIIIRTMKEQNKVRIEVEDNGPGIPEDVRKRIFEPFFSTKKTGEGTGLGLSVSYMIITNNHKGSITVESYPEKGTIFIVLLPY